MKTEKKSLKYEKAKKYNDLGKGKNAIPIIA